MEEILQIVLENSKDGLSVFSYIKLNNISITEDI
jgi:hypothetical protein